MNNQTLLNTITEAMLAQGHRSQRDGSCIYYDPTTNSHCPIGLLLVSAGIYHRDMEGRGILGLIQDFSRVREFFAENPSDLLYDIQNAHDYARDHDFRRNFSARISRVAPDYNCEVPPAAVQVLVP